MSERDELRERLIALLQDDNLPDWLADDRRVDGEIKADAVLSEIERTHRLVPKGEEPPSFNESLEQRWLRHEPFPRR